MNDAVGCASNWFHLGSNEAAVYHNTLPDSHQTGLLESLPSAPLDNALSYSPLDPYFPFETGPTATPAIVYPPSPVDKCPSTSINADFSIPVGRGPSTSINAESSSPVNKGHSSSCNADPTSTADKCPSTSVNADRSSPSDKSYSTSVNADCSSPKEFLFFQYKPTGLYAEKVQFRLLKFKKPYFLFTSLP